jgi:hypothetical protein
MLLKPGAGSINIPPDLNLQFIDRLKLLLWAQTLKKIKINLSTVEIA